jgi:tRNA A-37 threonylcarbamoyl transferase component Bud32
MAFVVVNPRYRNVLARSGLASAGDFLACAGEPVCLRADRRVERVVLGGNLIGYLKKETRILGRERLSSWWSGYGWTSKSVREGMVLGEVGAAGIACPVVLALGEEHGQAFVLLKEERGLEPLDRILHRRSAHIRRLAKLIGSELGRMHEAGFYHPDLFAKHILVGQSDGLDRLCIIDWQRTRWSADVPWSRRLVDLATLDASLADESVSERDRLRLLTSYLRHVAGPRPRLRSIISAIRSRAWLLLWQRRIHRQHVASVRPVPRMAPGNWHDWHNCPVRLTEPSRAVLPLVNYLRGSADLELRRRHLVLREAGRTLRDLHDAGYVSADPGLESWALSDTKPGDVEILLTSAADLMPATGPLGEGGAADLARLLSRHRATLRRTELLRVVRGYLGPRAPRRARRDLVRRILDAREPAR